MTAAQIPAHTHPDAKFYIRHCAGGYNNAEAGANTTQVAHDTAWGSTWGNGTSISSSAYYPNSITVKTVENTGGGGSHTNMPPWLAVYIWKRTA